MMGSKAKDSLILVRSIAVYINQKPYAFKPIVPAFHRSNIPRSSLTGNTTET